MAETRSTVREGLIVGLIGYSAVAVFFAVLRVSIDWGAAPPIWLSVGMLVAVLEGPGLDPGVEAGDIGPTGDDEPLGAVVGGFEQLEALEPGLVVDGSGASGEAAGEFVAGVGRHGDGVDADDGHRSIVASGRGRVTTERATDGQVATVCSWSRGASKDETSPIVVGRPSRNP